MSCGPKRQHASELVNAVMSRHEMRALRFSGFAQNLVIETLLCNFFGLQVLSLSWWATDLRHHGRDEMLSAFQAIGGLGELRLLHLQARFYDECNEHMTAIDDDIFAPIVQGCTKLRELALANMLGLGSRTWSDLGRHATELETVSLNFNYLVHRRGATMPALRGTADGYPLAGLLAQGTAHTRRRLGPRFQ